jgi:uncharacterized protein
MFNEIGRVEALRNLSKEHKLVFAIACSERLLPFYQRFYETEKWGNLLELKKIVDIIWGEILDHTLPTSQINNLIEQCANICPDTEEFSSPWAAPAMSVCVSIISTLECQLDGSTTKASESGAQALEAIYSYLYTKLDPESGFHAANQTFEKKLIESPMIKAEIEKQEQDLQLLNLTPSLTVEFIQTFRNSSLEMGELLLTSNNAVLG